MQTFKLAGDKANVNVSDFEGTVIPISSNISQGSSNCWMYLSKFSYKEQIESFKKMIPSGV